MKDVKLYLDSDFFGSVEVDYTGRWRTVNVNGEVVLYIECFRIVEVDTYKKLFGIVPYKSGTKVKARVTWHSEKNLRFVINDQINQCGGMYD